jgi:Phosphotransferase enzyme family
VLIDVVPIVRELVPGLLQHPRPSVACVRATHQKYLVFDGDASRPACVLEIGDETRLRRIDAVLHALHPLCPREVPRPLACVPWGQGEVVHIQQGLPGLPWFRLFETLGTTAAWHALLDRAVAVMSRLHGASAAVPAWTGSVDVAAALADEARASRAGGGSPALEEAIARCIDRLGGAAVMPAVVQHGDFSLNNLMVAADGVAVIDFEEFGLTRMPLHDAIGLGLSFSKSQDGRCPISVRECVERCIGGAEVIARFDDDLLRALVLHHLAWRINQSRGHAARAQLRATLIRFAEAVAVAPGNGLAGFAAA